MPFVHMPFLRLSLQTSAYRGICDMKNEKSEMVYGKWQMIPAPACCSCS
jgi:hypothetical protein